MKKTIIYAILGAAAILQSCQKEAASGRLGFEIEASNVEVVQLVKSSVSNYTSTPPQGDFTLLIKDESGTTFWTGLQKDWDSSSAVPVGNYTVNASYGDTDQEGFDKPCFNGSANFSVEPDKTSTVPVTVKLANCIIRIVCTDAFKNYFTDYTFTISTGASNQFSFPKSETRACFIDAFKFSVSGTLTNQGGQTQTFGPKEYTDLNAATCYTLKFDTNNTGGTSITITFDDTMDTVDLGDIELN